MQHRFNHSPREEKKTQMFIVPKIEKGLKALTDFRDEVYEEDIKNLIGETIVKYRSLITLATKGSLTIDHIESLKLWRTNKLHSHSVLGDYLKRYFSDVVPHLTQIKLEFMSGDSAYQSMVMSTLLDHVKVGKNSKRNAKKRAAKKLKKTSLEEKKSTTIPVVASDDRCSKPLAGSSEVKELKSCKSDFGDMDKSSTMSPTAETSSELSPLRVVLSSSPSSSSSSSSS